MYKITRPTHFKTCKRLLSTSAFQYSAFKPGFFTSVLSYENHIKPPSEEVLQTYPLLSSKDTHSRKIPPASSKMLLREFIDDSLYNPSYGFYSKSTHSPETELEEMEQEDHLQYISRLAKSHGHANYRTIHHLRYTLTELFKPWYGYAIAKYMVSEYKLNLYPHKDLIIYEIVGGNGQLMPHILDYIERYEPSVYKRTQYNMIELSDRIVSPSFIKTKAAPRHECVQVLDKDFFDWDTLVAEQCFFLGMEVINRFAHDVIRYNLSESKPHQGLICVDEKRNYTEIFEPVGKDDVISRYLSLRKKTRTKYVHPFTSRSLLWHKIQNYLNPSSSFVSNYVNYTYPEFIPTKLFQFFEILNAYFPGHRLVLTDYASLPNTIDGINAPLVQTVYKGLMVPCSTYLLPPGWYDVLFPTNFELLREMYLMVCRGSKAGNEKRVKAINYDDFLERYGDIEKSKVKKGVPMKLAHQSNVKVFLT